MEIQSSAHYLDLRLGCYHQRAPGSCNLGWMGVTLPMSLMFVLGVVATHAHRVRDVADAHHKERCN